MIEEKFEKALELLESIRKSTLETDVDSMGSLVQTDESSFENEIKEIKSALYFQKELLSLKQKQIEDYKQKLEYKDKKNSIVSRCLNEHIYYFNSFGEVKSLIVDSVDNYGAHCKYFEHSYSFSYKDFGKYWFLDEEECDKKAKEYIEKLGMPISLFKRIYNRLIKKKDVYYAYCRYTDSGIDDFMGDHYYYDKEKRQFVIGWEIDDDMGGHEDTEELPLDKYGITWSIYKKDLKPRKAEEE